MEAFSSAVRRRGRAGRAGNKRLARCTSVASRNGASRRARAGRPRSRGNGLERRSARGHLALASNRNCFMRANSSAVRSRGRARNRRTSAGIPSWNDGFLPLDWYPMLQIEGKIALGPGSPARFRRSAPASGQPPDRGRPALDWAVGRRFPSGSCKFVPWKGGPKPREASFLGPVVREAFVEDGLGNRHLLPVRRNACNQVLQCIRVPCRQIFPFGQVAGEIVQLGRCKPFGGIRRIVEVNLVNSYKPR